MNNILHCYVLYFVCYTVLLNPQFFRRTPSKEKNLHKGQASFCKKRNVKVLKIFVE